MHFTIDRKVLLTALTSIKFAQSKYSTLPILANVKITARKSAVEFAATDLGTYADFTVHQECFPGAVTCDLEELLTLIKPRDQEKITFRLDEEGKLLITSESVTAVLDTMPAKDFPKSYEERQIGDTWEAWGDTTCTVKDRRVQLVRLSTTELAHLVKMVAHAASRDEHPYPVLTAVHTHVEHGVLTMVAAEAFRLAMYELPLSSDQTWDEPLLIPARPLTDLVKRLPKEGAVEIMAVFPTIEERRGNHATTNTSPAYQVAFRSGPMRVTTRLIEGRYPPFRSVIPQEHITQLTVDASALARVLPRKKTEVLLFQISDHLEVRDGSNVKRVVAKLSGPALSVSYFAEWIKDFLACSPTGTFIFSYTQESQVAKITLAHDPGFTGVLVPCVKGSTVPSE